MFSLFENLINIARFKGPGGYFGNCGQVSACGCVRIFQRLCNRMKIKLDSIRCARFRSALRKNSVRSKRYCEKGGWALACYSSTAGWVELAFPKFRLIFLKSRPLPPLYPRNRIYIWPFPPLWQHRAAFSAIGVALSVSGPMLGLSFEKLPPQPAESGA